MRIFVQLIFDSLVYLQACPEVQAETPATKSKYFFIIGCVDIRTLCIRNLHTQWIGEGLCWYFKKSVFKTIIYLIVLLSPLVFSFYRSSRFPSDFHWDIFLYSFSFFFIILSLSLFSSSENRSSFDLFVHYRQTRPLSFAFKELFSQENISVNLLKSNRFHSVIFKDEIDFTAYIFIDTNEFLSHFA
jgi:hypothetical protein